MSKQPITAKGKEGKRAKTRMERDRRAKLTGKMKILLYNTKHTHTHMFSEHCLLCIISRVFIHTSHTQTHTFPVYFSLSFVCVCDGERVGCFLFFSMCVCTYGWVGDREGGRGECILELLASQCRTSDPSSVKRMNVQSCLIPDLHQTPRVLSVQTPVMVTISVIHTKYESTSSAKALSLTRCHRGNGVHLRNRSLLEIMLS